MNYPAASGRGSSLNILKRSVNNKLLKFLEIAILVAALVIAPSVSIHNLHSFDAPSLEFSVKAQAVPAAEKTKAQPSSQASESAPRMSENSQAASGSEESEASQLDVTEMVLGSLAGLVLFLYGVTRLAQGLETIAGDRAKRLLDKFTTNRFVGVLTGAMATTILDSSSVTIIMVIAMVSAGLLNYVQSLGVVLGSNIGTTVGAEIIAFDINKYAPIALFFGLVLHFIGKTDRWRNIGLILLGVGLLFFGLDTIDNAMKPLRGYQPFIEWMRTLGERPLQGALIGSLFTVLIQSSSATVAIIVTLASSGSISLAAGVALMLGAEVGNCADTLVATIGRGRAALRTGVFHLLFNIICAAVGILFATQLAALAQGISFGAGVGRQIANAQVIFNVLGVAIVIAFLPLIARLLEKLIPEARSLRSERQSVKV